MELSMEQLEMLVSDARMMRKASLTELLEKHRHREENPIVWKLEDVIREVDNPDWHDMCGLTYKEACNAFLIYKLLDDELAEILKNRTGTEGIVTREQLDKEIENLKIEFNLT